MRIAIGCDHAGLTLKQSVMGVLSELGHEYQDFGCHDTVSVDYPDISQKVSQAVAGGGFEQGILICSTGIGMSMSANKVPGIRAALCHDTFSAHRTREHNNANVLCLGASVVGLGLAEEIVRTYLAAAFEGGRHLRRVEKMLALEKNL